MGVNIIDRLFDSRSHGVGTELIIVEGEAAANAVAGLRDSQTQAVLPMQGKPLNALKAKPEKVLNYALYESLSKSLGTGMGVAFDIKQLRYERVVLLFEPDADGIHSSALMLMYFMAYMRPLLALGHVHMVYAPWMSVKRTGEEPVYLYNEAHSRQYCQQLRTQNIAFEAQRFHGLAAFEAQELQLTCVLPQSRKSLPMGLADAQAGVAAFGGY